MVPAFPSNFIKKSVHKQYKTRQMILIKCNAIQRICFIESKETKKQIRRNKDQSTLISPVIFPFKMNCSTVFRTNEWIACIMIVSDLYVR